MDNLKILKYDFVLVSSYKDGKLLRYELSEECRKSSGDVLSMTLRKIEIERGPGWMQTAWECEVFVYGIQYAYISASDTDEVEIELDKVLREIPHDLSGLLN